MSKSKIFIIIIFLLMLFSCSSVPKFVGDATLCCLVVDENNQPIKNCIGELKKNNFTQGKSITNENGILVFENVSSGKYEISFIKEGYEEKNVSNVLFVDKGRIFCFQLNSAKYCIDTVDAFINDNKMDQALQILSQINTQKNDFLPLLISTYKFYIFVEKKDSTLANKELKKIRKLVMKMNYRYVDCSLLEKKLEDI